MKRKIIEIDDEKCNGCGKCLPNCPEGALQLIDGKARLISDLFCDGLGACLGECPRGAIHTVEREAEPYDEVKVMGNIVKQGENTIRAHLTHLKSHGEFKLYEQALDFLGKNGIPVPDGKLPCGCSGTFAKKIVPKSSGMATGGGASALRQWPVQLKLLNPQAEYFENADLLVSADCVAHAHGAFHRDFLDGRILVIFCPKLDSGIDGYVEKLAEIFKCHKIRSVTVARMEVPCCGGTLSVVHEALERAGLSGILVPETIVVGLDGGIQKKER